MLAIDVSRSMEAKDVNAVAARRGAQRRRRVPRQGAEHVQRRARRVREPRVPRRAADDRHALVRTGARRASRPAKAPRSATRSLLSAQLGQQPEGERTASCRPTSVLAHLRRRAPRAAGPRRLAAAKRAKALHVPVSTVLVGTPNGVVTRPLTGGYKEQIRVPPSPGTLQADRAQRPAASSSGGRTSAALDTVYEHLATRSAIAREDREITDVFAGGALVAPARRRRASRCSGSGESCEARSSSSCCVASPRWPSPRARRRDERVQGPAGLRSRRRAVGASRRRRAAASSSSSRARSASSSAGSTRSSAAAASTSTSSARSAARSTPGSRRTGRRCSSAPSSARAAPRRSGRTSAACPPRAAASASRPRSRVQAGKPAVRGS